MRGLIVVFVLGIVAAVGTVYMIGQMNKETGPTILLAFGQPDENNQVEINICIPIAFRKPEVPPEGGMPKILPWTQWIERHWELKDQAGNRIEMDSIGSSLLISDTKAGGAPDGWVRGRMPAGNSYTLDYIADVESGKRSRIEFTADEQLKDRTRVTFEIVES